MFTAVNLRELDEHIFNQNSIYFPGTAANTAIKYAAGATVIIGLVSSCIVANGFPLGGTVLLSGTVVVSAGGALWYRHRVNAIQKAAKTLFDRVPEVGEGLSAFLKDKRIWMNPSQNSFFNAEFMRRILGILNDKECFEANQLRALLNSHYFPFDSQKHKFLANQILKLDDAAKKFVLTQDSPDAQKLIVDMMIGIRHSTDNFDTLYELIPDSIRTQVLFELGKLSLELFARALKQTQGFSRLISGISDEEFDCALSKVYSQEFMHVEDIEASTQFLVELYFLLESSHIPQAFSIDASQVNPLGLKLWAKVVCKTEAAVVYREEFDALLIQKSERKPSLFVRLKQHWNVLQEDLKIICQNTGSPTLFSLFVHLLNSELSENERAYVQEMKLEEIEKLIESAPEFLQIWLENKEISIPQLCMDYIQRQPDKNKARNFFNALSSSQIFVWLQSSDRCFIDFTKKSLQELCNFSSDLIFRQSHLKAELSKSESRGDGFTADNLWDAIDCIEQHLEWLRKHKRQASLIPVDLLVLWQKIGSIDNRSEKIEWMAKLYQWCWELGEEETIESLVYYEQGMKNDDYVKEIESKIEIEDAVLSGEELESEYVLEKFKISSKFRS